MIKTFLILVIPLLSLKSFAQEPKILGYLGTFIYEEEAVMNPVLAFSKEDKVIVIPVGRVSVFAYSSERIGTSYDSASPLYLAINFFGKDLRQSLIVDTGLIMPLIGVSQVNYGGQRQPVGNCLLFLDDTDVKRLIVVSADHESKTADFYLVTLSQSYAPIDEIMANLCMVGHQGQPLVEGSKVEKISKYFPDAKPFLSTPVRLE